MRGRDGGIRTRDPLHPMQVRYQAALHPEAQDYISEADRAPAEVPHALNGDHQKGPMRREGLAVVRLSLIHI